MINEIPRRKRRRKVSLINPSLTVSVPKFYSLVSMESRNRYSVYEIIPIKQNETNYVNMAINTQVTKI